MDKSMKVLGFVAVLVMGAIASTAMASADITSKSDAKSLSATIYVPDNYIKIQWAIDNATVGDTIIVRDGTYTENVDVNKRLTIRSENGSAPTIVQTANSSDHVFEVTADYVNISGFEADGLNGYKTPYKVGICLYYVDHCNISNNYCRGNRDDGIQLSHSNNNSITNNICASNDMYGIRLVRSNNNSISSNDCSHNHHGIGIVYSNQNSISNNTCSHNSYETCMSSFPFMCFRGGYGICLSNSNNNSISNNTCSYNYYDSNIYLEDSNNNSISSNDCSRSMHGICFERSSNNKLKGNIMLNKGIDISGYSLSHYKHEIDESNIMNGKPVYYWKDVNGGRVPDGAGQVILVNCTNVVIENQNINKTSFGIEVAFSSSITIKSNTCSYNHDGIFLKYSNNNSIFNNTCSYGGMALKYSNNNSIFNNTCSWDGHGISLKYSNNNSISNNTCSYNTRGIPLKYSSNNSITNNNCSNSECSFHSDDCDSNGICIWCDSDNNSISNNICTNNRNDGIYIDSNNNILTNNTASNNRYGIHLSYSSNSILTNNTMLGNSYNFGVRGNSHSDYIHSIDTSNTVDGKTVYYWINQQNRQIPNDAGFVGIINSTNITVRDLTLSRNDQSVLFVYTNSSRIENVNASKNHDAGIHLYMCSNNTLTNNTANSNYYRGIHLSSSSDNTLTGNTASDNRDGIEIYKSSNNKIYLNNFINNADNVDSSKSTNIWNSTEELTYTYNGTTHANYLGNYWDDYTDVDANNDGIWDHPRSINPDQDYHPLVAPFENYFSHQVQRGDLNGDGHLTAADAAIALQVVVSGEHNNNADVNGDDRATSLDVLMILQAVAEVIVL